MGTPARAAATRDDPGALGTHGVKPPMNVAPIAHPSANFGARPAGAEIDILLLHYTGMASAEDALARLCDPAAGVSAQYLVDEGGQV